MLRLPKNKMVMKNRIFFGFLIFNIFFLSVNLWARERKEISIVDPKTKRKALAVADEILVKFKPGVKVKTINEINEELEGRIRKKIEKIDVYCIKILSRETVLEMIEKYEKNPNVEYAEPNYIRKAYIIPDDPGCQGSPPPQWGIFKIKAPQGWETETGASSIIIGIVDSGVNYNHVDLNDHIWTNDDSLGDGIDNDVNGKVDDYRGWDFVGSDYMSPVEDNDPMDVVDHGTYCAGIASAETDNTIGMAGVSWNSKIMVVRVLDDSGYSDDSIIAPGIRYAADEGADIINLSLGGAGSSTTLENAVNYAFNKGCVLAAASGNDNESSVNYPAAYDNVIAVGATNVDDERCDVSDWGYDLEGKPQGSNYGAELDVVAPGHNIYSTSLGGVYGYPYGTSMAAPFVSGLAALIWSHNPTLTNVDVRDNIVSSVDDIGSNGWDAYTGYGRINAEEALAAFLSEEVVYGIMNFPNPFRPARTSQTTICFTTRESVAERNIYIYDVAGELVHTVPESEIFLKGIDPQNRRVYKYEWDGKNDYGEKVASGVYIFVVNADGNKKVGKLAVIK
ncbi:MAG: S8 family serine peptidase [bacterium]